MMIYNADYYVTSPSGKTEHFLIKTQSDKAEFYPGDRLVYHVSPEDKLSFGRLLSTGIEVWAKRQGQPDNPSFYDRCALMLWSLLTEIDSPYLKKGVTFTRARRCYFCNRKLKSQASQIVGVGPECAHRHQDYFVGPSQLELPFGESQPVSGN